MPRNFFKKIISYLIVMSLVTPVILPLEAHAQMYEGARDMDWNKSTDRCEGGGWREASAGRSGGHDANVLDFDPFGSNMDINWEITNGVCAAFLSGVIATLTAQSLLNRFAFCSVWPGNIVGLNAGGSATTNAMMGPMLPPVPGPGYLLTIAGNVSTCALMSGYAASATASCPSAPMYCAGAPVSTANATSCCTGVALMVAEVAAAVAALAIIYGVADGVYKKARICGHNWLTWDKVKQDPVTKLYVHDDNGTWVRGAYSDSHKYKVDQIFKAGTASASDINLNNVNYREYIFGGVEFKDSGDGACKNPWDDATRKIILGYDDDEQRYYMKGPNSAPVFACYRFLMTRGDATDIAAGQAAYDCCVKRSQTTVCIENAANVVGSAGNDYDHAFCEIGSRCNVKGVWFDAYASRKQSNYACAKTYSVCPYNHPLGGGTEVQNYTTDATSMDNSCQYMAHCSVIPVTPYVVHSSLTGGYFDSSCKDMKGYSQNTYGFASSLASVSNLSFSAAMAQCFKETMQNVFFNIAGHSECSDPNETPSADGVCLKGYKFKAGDSLSTYQKSLGETGDSFFVKVQNGLQSSIKMALTLAIIFFGIAVLIGGAPISKKQILTFVLKIALVMYFAVGDAWQGQMMNGIIGTSTQLSQMMFGFDPNYNPTTTSTSVASWSSTTNGVTTIANQVSTASDETIIETNVNGTGVVDHSKLDGCQFPKYDYANPDEATRYWTPRYPPDREYLVVWDTLDCKIARALGFGIDVSVPNLIMMVLGGFLTGGAGIIFFIATFAFAFFLIGMTVRALQIFLMSIMSIVVLSYMAPLMVTLAMFERTKGIFKKWYEQILGFALQPMILFAYMGVMLTLFNTVIIGDVTFTGDGKSVPKQIVCSDAVKNTSIYCIFNPPAKAIGTDNGLKMLGIGLPILADMNQTKITSLLKAGILLFILSQFMDKITELAAKLVGGNQLKGTTMSAVSMMSKAGGAARGVQKRAMGMLKKNVAPMAARAGGAAMSGVAALGDRGKGASAPADEKSSGGNKTDDS